MATVMKRLPLQVRLRNRTDQQVVFWWDGIPYIWEPGEEIANIDVNIAGHFVGRHKVGLPINPPHADDAKAIRKEEQRVLAALPRNTRERGVPLEIVEIVDPNKRLEAAVNRISSVPVTLPIVEEEGPEPFAALHREIGRDQEAPEETAIEEALSYDELDVEEG